MPSPALLASLSLAALLGAASLSPARAAAPAPSPVPAWTVRYVYLVSADRPVRQDFVQAIARAARTVQAFYGRQLGGPTFRLADPVVEVVRSDKAATWFYAHDSGSADKDNWGFDNGLAEAARLVGAGQGQRHTWVIYSDGPGNSGRGGGGVAVMPEDDLLGLVGEHPTQKDPRRWVYGMAHELGHALGLAHPQDSAAVPNAVMGAGFYTCFPDACELTPDDLAILRASPFIRDWSAVAAAPAERSVYRYDGGDFTREVEAGRATWVEHARGGLRFAFVEAEGGPDAYLLHDPSRGFFITVPWTGGMSRISTDGRTWRDLYDVTPEAP